ncbi:hypothetical protein ABH920_008819 [Catenulispora sp. EB89]|uniref:kinase n=1 Tax=Catenulispora sp. EB89 TaxID=3156257 RepID=UPI0035198989
MPSPLIVLRGPSGSGKSRTATALRERYGRGLAIVRQDVVRRDILRERDLVEGIMDAGRYGAMLAALLADHAGAAHSYYFDIPFDVTVERHFTKPNHADWTVDDMRDWYVEHDVLPGGVDRVIGSDSTEHDTVERILAETGLLAADRPPHPSLAD